MRGSFPASAVVAATFVVLLQMLGCASLAPRHLEYDTASEATKDGLLRLRTRTGAAFVRPSSSLSRFQKVAIGPSSTTYRAESPRKPGERPRGGARDSETTARISEILRESIEREFLMSNRFSVATAKGADVLWIRAYVVDLDIDFSPLPSEQRTMGGHLGEVTLILDVRDSQTREARVRLLERRELSVIGITSSTSVAANTWESMEKNFSEFAYHVRRELESLADVEMPPAPAQAPGGP
jgi:hypothetical protein